MKKYYFILAAAAALATVSCEKESPAPEDTLPIDNQEQTVTEQTLTNPVTLTFTANAAQTKVSLEGEGTNGAKTAVWDEGDQVKVIWYNEEMKSTTVTVDSYGTASTTFTATVEEADYYYAVYPATIEATLDGEGNFTVNFPNNRTITEYFSDAAWYAAKTTKAVKEFAFHPISTIIKFTVDETDAEGIHFRSLGGDLNKLFGIYPVTFTDSASDGVFEELALGTPSGGENNVEISLSSGAGTYYLMLPANGSKSSNTTYGDGFIFKIRKTGENIPAAYYSNVITLTPGKFYNIKSAIDTKITWDYYLSADGTGTGLSSESYSNPERIKGALDAGGHVAFTSSRAASYMRDGVTIHLKGGTYSTPITLINEQVMSRTINIVGGADGTTTTFTTSASSTFGYSNVNVSLSNITFSGCSTASSINITAGNVSFSSCNFISNTATNGGALSIGNGSSTDSNLIVNFTDCIFDGNSATQHGGVILIPNAATGGIAAFNNCLFSNNVADGDRTDSAVYNAGVAYTSGGKTALLFNNCSFTGNTATTNGKVIYLNNANARLGMNNCTINAGSSNAAKQTTAPIEGGTHQIANGTAITNKGLTVFANSTIWSKDGIGEWGLIGLGSASVSNGSTVVNSLIRNGATFTKPAFYNHSSYFQNVQFCVYTGNATITEGKHTFENSWDLGTAQGQTITGASYKNKAISGVTQYYYTWTNDLAAAGFTKPSKEQISNIIAKTAESSEDAKDGFGKLFLDWLEEVGGLDTDIIGTQRPEEGFKPGSAE